MLSRASRELSLSVILLEWGLPALVLNVIHLISGWKEKRREGFYSVNEQVFCKNITRTHNLLRGLSGSVKDERMGRRPSMKRITDQLPGRNPSLLGD